MFALVIQVLMPGHAICSNITENLLLSAVAIYADVYIYILYDSEIYGVENNIGCLECI